MFDNKYPNGYYIFLVLCYLNIERHVSEILFGMGLRPEIALSCAFHLLYTPNELVLAKFASTFAILTDPEPLKIGIMVRVADTEFDVPYVIVIINVMS